MKPEYMFGEPPTELEFNNEQIKQYWPSAQGELYGFAKALQRKSPITALQLRLALQLAEQAFQHSKSELVTACELVMSMLTSEDEESWQRSQAYDEAPYHFLWLAIRNANSLTCVGPGAPRVAAGQVGGVTDVSKVEVRDAGQKGRGVFAREPIVAGRVIELAPVIVLTQDDTKLVDGTILARYYFEWGDDNVAAVALGCGSLYNHSYTPNADYFLDYVRRVIRFVAVRNIGAGEEVLINYNGLVGDDATVSFTVL